MRIVMTSAIHNFIVKRKMPEGGFLSRDLLMKAGSINIEEDFQWKEWSILVLYSLCESELITPTEKKLWGKLIFEGNRKVCEYLREYSHNGDLYALKKSLEQLT